LAFSDIPLTADGLQVFIKRAYVINDAMSVARAIAGVQSVMGASAASFSDNAFSPSIASGSAVPEPSTAVLALAGCLGAMFAWSRKIRR
jgi:hypothetical protein